MLELATYLSHPFLVCSCFAHSGEKEMRYPAITVVPVSDLFQEFIAVGLNASEGTCRCFHTTSHCIWVISKFLILMLLGFS